MDTRICTKERGFIGYSTALTTTLFTWIGNENGLVFYFSVCVYKGYIRAILVLILICYSGGMPVTAPKASTNERPCYMQPGVEGDINALSKKNITDLKDKLQDLSETLQKQKSKLPVSNNVSIAFLYITFYHVYDISKYLLGSWMLGFKHIYEEPASILQ